MIDFVSLHNHSHYSILDALSSPKDLINRAKELGQKAIAITDHGTLASAWTAFKTSKDSGVKLIMGCEMYFLDDTSKTDQRFRHIILLAKNDVGYKNLLSLNKEGFDHSVVFAKRVYPIIDWTLLEKYSEGIICLTSCSNGILSQLLMNKQFEEAEIQLDRLVRMFGRDNLGLEVQANTLKRGSNIYNDVIEQVFVNAQIIKLAKKHNLRCVATCNSHYIKKEDHATHDVLLAIGSHQNIYSNFRLKYDCPEFYIKTGEEIKSFFERNYGGEYAEELCANSVFFADQCEEPKWIDPKYSNPSGKELPEFPIQDEKDYCEFLTWAQENSHKFSNLDRDKLFLRFRCDKLFNERVASKVDPTIIPEYLKQIEEELDVFEFHGFSSYMLIVADYIDWARSQKIPVGPGRGSVGGSIVAYLLGIHQADPIKYGLIFARFHNKEKSSFPDIDTDFASSGRDLVQQYIRDKYGNEYVAHVSNINTITPKVYARDMARACEFGGDRESAVRIGTEIADTLAKDVHSIDHAIEHVPLFGEYCKKYPELKQHAQINSKMRAWSTHAAGLVISRRPLAGLIPIRRDKDGVVALEYDKDQAEENGLVKMDLLSLSTLDTIEMTRSLIAANGKELPPELMDFDVYDEATYDLISRGDTFGVFQLGTSGGTIDLCKRIKPKSIKDISYINSLARPSAREMRDAFILTKDGKRAFSLLHPKLDRAFTNTFGFGLYEESLMYLAQDVAGWNLHSADRLRKLTKEKGKNPAKAIALRKEFIDDAVRNQVNEEIAKRIWDEVVDKFQGYGFNQSHSIFYSMIAYTTAFYKAHFPIEFLLANLMAEVNSNTPDAQANIDKIKKEIRSHKVKITPPILNKSLLSYAMMNDKELVTGLDALKFVGDDAIKDIIAKRPFNNFFDFMVRVDSKSVRANTIQALAASGTLDSFKISRKLMFLYCSDYRKKLQVWLKKHDPSKEEFFYPWPDEKEWTPEEIYALEMFYLGEAFYCGKKDAYGKFFAGKDSDTIDKLRKVKDKTPVASFKVQIKDFFEFKVKKETSKYYGKSMIKATVEDINGDQCSLTIFPDRWEQIPNRIKHLAAKGIKASFDVGVALHLKGVVNIYEDDLGVILDDLYDFHPIPSIPDDLKPKKVNLKIAKKDKSEATESFDFSFDDIEDELYDEGLIELDDESND